MHVVHCKKKQFSVYIGRPGIFGNPFRIGQDGSRDEVIAKYEQMVRKQVLFMSPLVKAIRALPADSVLGCYCNPLACHGDVIVKIWKELHRGS